VKRKITEEDSLSVPEWAIIFGLAESAMTRTFERHGLVPTKDGYRKMFKVADVLAKKIPIVRPIGMSHLQGRLMDFTERSTWISAEECSRLFPVVKETIYRWYALGRCRGKKVSRNVLFNREEISQMVATMRRPAKGTPPDATEAAPSKVLAPAAAGGLETTECQSPTVTRPTVEPVQESTNLSIPISEFTK
jgi:hypothetical protein